MNVTQILNCRSPLISFESPFEFKSAAQKHDREQFFNLHSDRAFSDGNLHIKKRTFV